MSPVSKDNLDSIFTYHPADDLQVIRYEAIRSKAKEMAEVILDNTPLCADQTAAIRKLRESVMTANAAIALKGIVALALALAVGSLAFAADCPCAQAPQAPKTAPAPAKSVKAWKPTAPAPAVAPVVCPPCPEPTVVERRVEVPVVVERKVPVKVIEVPAPAQGQWYLFPSLLYLDRPGVAFGPGYKFKDGTILMGQVLYRDPLDAANGFSKRIGCRTFTCPACDDQGGFGISFTVGIPLDGH